VQVYVARPDSAVERPVRWLAAYAWVSAEPGESVTVDVPVPRRAFEHWDGAWVVEPGAYEIHVGRSAGDIVLAAPRIL